MATGLPLTSETVIPASQLDAATVTNYLTNAHRDGLPLTLSSTLTTGTAQPISLADAIFAGYSPGGSPLGVGVSGVIAFSFAAAAVETGVGAGDAGLGAAAAADRPYPVATYPGERLAAYGALAKVDADAVVLSNVLSTAAPPDANAPVYLRLSYRSDLAANLKWRGWFHYRRAADGFEVPFTPDTSLANCQLRVNYVTTLDQKPVASGLGVPLVGGSAAALGPKSVGTTQLTDAVVSALTDARPPTAHSHAPGDVTGIAVVTADVRFAPAPVIGDAGKVVTVKGDGSGYENTAVSGGGVPTGRLISTAADSGLSGGGDLSADRSLVVNIHGTTEETSVADADEVLLYDASGAVLRRMTRSNFLSGLAPITESKLHSGDPITLCTYTLPTNYPMWVFNFDADVAADQNYWSAFAGIRLVGTAYRNSGGVMVILGTTTLFYYAGADWGGPVLTATCSVAVWGTYPTQGICIAIGSSYGMRVSGTLRISGLVHY